MLFINIFASLNSKMPQKHALFTLLLLLYGLTGLGQSWSETFNTKSNNEFTLSGWTFNEDGSFYFSSGTEFAMNSRHIRSQNIRNNSPVSTYTGYLYFNAGTSYTTSFEHACVCYNINNSNAFPRIEIGYESFETGAIVSTTSGIITQQGQLNTSSTTFTPTQSGWYRLRILLSRQSNNGSAAVALDNFTSNIPVNTEWNDTTVPMDQQITLTASETAVQNGDNVVFNIDYSLNSYQWYTRVKGAEFVINLPNGFQYQSHQITGWNFDNAQTSYDPNTGLLKIFTNNVPPSIKLTINTIAQNVEAGSFASVYASNFQPQNPASASVNPTPITIIPSSTQPVELIEWDGKAAPEGNVLYWATAMELNNDKFIIERSKDGKHFLPIASIEGAGDHSGRLNYSFTDKTAYSGVSYYRLTQLDFNGDAKTYSLIRVFREPLTTAIKILQNPSTSHRIVMQLPQDDWHLQIYTESGRLVYQTQLSPSDVMNNVVEINGLQLAPELHIIRLTNNKSQWAGRLLIR
jgi:hypothetical protein